MSLRTLRMRKFTAFEALDLAFAPGINIFLGANGTGKTHVMKTLYAACDVSKSKLDLADKLIRVFLPSGRALGRLVKRQKTSSKCTVTVDRVADLRLRAAFSNHAMKADDATVVGAAKWAASPVSSVYIPVKEMLSNAPGFRSLYAEREIHFEEVYADVLDRAYKPKLRGPADRKRKHLLAIIQKAIEGTVSIKREEFFLHNRQGNLEFTLLAEGMRKLALLWLLIQNGTLLSGSVLFWDEPETNLNPTLYGFVVDILLELQRLNVQTFLATHDYLILKEFDLRQKEGDSVAYHSLYRDQGTSEIACHTASRFTDIHPNAIAEAFADVYDREIKRSLGGQK